MAWDFSTEPEFQEKLDWIREFVKTEIEPIDLAFDHQFVYDKTHQRVLPRGRGFYLPAGKNKWVTLLAF